MLSNKLFLSLSIMLLSAGSAYAACGGDIVFKPGASSGHIAGSIQQRQYCDYRFRARAGQQLKLSYADSQRPQVFLVAPIERQMLSDDEYILPDSGVYDLRVMLTRNDARKYAKPQPYAITVSIVDVDPAVAA